jgi:hypothetical protein
VTRSLSPEYRRMINGPEWAQFRADYWATRRRPRGCTVCGAARRRRPPFGWRWLGYTDLNHLRYRTKVQRDGWGQETTVFARPGRFDVAPACHRPCHMTIITPLSRNPLARLLTAAALTAGYGLPAVRLTGSVLPGVLVAVWCVAALALPRGYSAVMLGAALGLPVRMVRRCWVVVSHGAQFFRR